MKLKFAISSSAARRIGLPLITSWISCRLWSVNGHSVKSQPTIETGPTVGVIKESQEITEQPKERNATRKAFSTNGCIVNMKRKASSALNVAATDLNVAAVLARNALSFLRTNSTLKSLTVSFQQPQKESYVSAFRLEAVKMLENTFLESLTIQSSGSNIDVEEFVEQISALQRDTTLKTLDFDDTDESFYYKVEKANRLVPILMKKYGLENLAPVINCTDYGTIKAILRLNGAGRRYLIKDGSSISKGVDVLSAVSDEIDCVFLHLLENPGLCDRRGVETNVRSHLPGANLDESTTGGKRDRAQSQPCKEPRRRP
jgi:hypothetical protein